MGTIIYFNKTKEHLANPAIYKEFNSNPTQAIKMIPFPPSKTETETI